MRKSRKQTGPPPINIGAYLDGESDIPNLAFAYPETNQVLSAEDESGRPVARIIATLPNWSSMTRPVDLQLLNMPRYPMPSNFEIARKLLETADRSNELTQNVFQAKYTHTLSYDFIKTNGHEQLYLTTAPQADSEEAAVQARGQINQEAEIIIEPRMHSHWRAARHFAVKRNTFEQDGSDHDKTPNVAVLAITKTGYGFAIGQINNNTPVYAPEDLADEEMLQMSPMLSGQALASSAIDLLEEKMEPAALTHERINARAEIATFITCDEEIWRHVQALLRPSDNGALTPSGIPLFPLNIEENGTDDKPSNPALVAAYGAALGTLIPSEEIVNLSDPLPERVNRIQRERDEATAQVARQKRMRAALILFALPLLTLGWMIGSWWSASTEVSDLTRIKQQKEARSVELQAFIKKRNDANLNFAYCQDLAKQIFIQRAKQPSVAGLLVDLDYLWPVGDPSWYVSGLAISPGGTGQIDIRGRSKTLDAFTEFTKQLENLRDEKGAGKFMNIRPGTGEVGAGGAQGAASGNPIISAQPVVPTMPQPGASRPAQGPFEWSVTATYSPLIGAPKPAAQGAPK